MPFSVYKVSTPYGQICKGGVSVERHLTDRGRYNIRQLPCSRSTDCQFRTRSWTSSSSIQKWHFSHTCCTMEAKEEVRRVYLWELGFGFVSLHLPDLWELVAPEWFRPAQDSLSASLSISISEIVGLVSLWQIPQKKFSRSALEDQFWSCLFCITSMKRGQWHVLNMFWSLSDVSLSLYSFLALILAQKSDKEGEAKFFSKLILSSWNINKVPLPSLTAEVTLLCEHRYQWQI